MNVKEVMNREVRTIRMGERLDAAARVMWDHDCGIVPVVDGNGAVVGIVTDRDLCMAAWTQGRPLAEIPATAAMARAVRSCKPDDAITTALAAMQQHQLHRLPVVDARGVLIGIIGLNDLVRLAASRPAVLDPSGVTKALAAIGAPRKAAAKPAPAPAPAPAAALAKPLNAPPASTTVAAAAPIPVALPAIVKPAKAKNGKHGKGKKS